MQPKKLEAYKYFKHLAWTLIILFATFVFILTIKLQTVVQKMETSNVSMEERLQNLEKEVYQNQ